MRGIFDLRHRRQRRALIAKYLAARERNPGIAVLGEEASADPRVFGLTASDLHAIADRAYAPDDERLEAIEWTYDVQVKFGVIRSRLRALADAIEDETP